MVVVVVVGSTKRYTAIRDFCINCYILPTVMGDRGTQYREKQRGSAVIENIVAN